VPRTERPDAAQRSRQYDPEAVQIVDYERLLDVGAFSASAAFSRVDADLRDAIDHVRWPPGAQDFTINPTKDGNGVKVIKAGFIEYLRGQGWELERRFAADPEDVGAVQPGAFDAWLSLDRDGLPPFVAEWETGNISSTHRAVNKIALGLVQERLSGGVVVLPTRNLYQYLTDRIGNFREIEPYFPVWRVLPVKEGFLAVISVEHDRESEDVPRFVKGTDGRALG
jgi:restriction endonuclease BamHI